jgi:predicted RNA binding protein YcfA (HicA-like mRNA interferase family)
MSGKELIRLLEKEGWICKRIKGSHHVMYKEGLVPVIVPVHSNRDIASGTLNSILKKSGLKK